MSAPTKADPLHSRMAHAFGQAQVAQVARLMLADSRVNLLDLLTDDARDELLRRCISDHKFTRRNAAANRANHRRLRAV